MCVWTEWKQKVACLFLFFLRVHTVALHLHAATHNSHTHTHTQVAAISVLSPFVAPDQTVVERTELCSELDTQIQYMHAPWPFVSPTPRWRTTGFL